MKLIKNIYIFSHLLFELLHFDMDIIWWFLI